jgi:hypothetical protein
MPRQRREVNVFLTYSTNSFVSRRVTLYGGLTSHPITIKRKDVWPMLIDHSWRPLSFEYFLNLARATDGFRRFSSRRRNFRIPG